MIKKIIVVSGTLLLFFNAIADQAEKRSSYIPNISKGEKIYQNNCSVCHGIRGTGETSISRDKKIKPAVLGDPLTLNKLSPVKVFDILTQGIPKSGMPSYQHLEQNDRWDVAAFIFTLNYEFQIPSGDVRPTINWGDASRQTNLQLMELYRKRGVPEEYLQKEISATRYIIE